MLIRTDWDIRRRYRWLLLAVAVAALWVGDLRSQPAADLLLVGGFVHDGSGQPPGRQDVGVVGERISFVGDAAAAGLDAAVVVDVDGLMVTPGFIDMHSHAELTEDYGQDALPFLHQGITTVAIGKLRQFVLDERIITMPFAIRSMTGLAADFLYLDDRGYVRVGAIADIAVFDGDRIRDRATYDHPRQQADGTVHVLVNGRFAIRDGEATGALAGRPIRRATRTGGSVPGLWPHAPQES